MKSWGRHLGLLGQGAPLRDCVATRGPVLIEDQLGHVLLCLLISLIPEGETLRQSGYCDNFSNEEPEAHSE